ncbi:hypothetical protein ESCO_005806 [Escovopsis weberi]|uniref:Uncharacterized protein n=1 Tax=Escovopsis weberi TaxID=150374 RepID=A0A0M8N4V1_ESCWE|nr:hypothetical protein ESCO_005806 [Escovopsis weberi]
MAEAERDRMRLNARIERLELDKEELETQNSLKVQDNLALIDQLESLNNTVFDADAKIKTLEATLLSSQQALVHLEGTASRAVDAERHLKELVEEQERLQGELQSSREEARSHAYRFKEAQRGILDMQDQLDRMEREARQERERHAETVEKMGRQREVEKQLNAAAQRLKGAAASKPPTHKKHRRQASSKTVGNFVKDLLQDNATLQLAIAELREMLFNSNDEIQSLREQLLFHQPVSQGEKAAISSAIKAELEPLMDSPKLSQEMRSHHHCHLKQDTRGSGKKRHSTLGSYPPTSPLRPSSTPAVSSSSNEWRSVSTPAGSSSRSCNEIPCNPSMPVASGCWAEYSSHSSAVSSVIGSPQSSSRGYFDQVVPDADRPVSPSTSYDPISPTWRASHKKRASEASSSSLQSLADSESARTHAHYSHRRWASATIREEDEEDHLSETLRSIHHSSLRAKMALADELDLSQTEDETEDESESGPIRPSFHRSNTHEYSMSLAGGLDMSALVASPGQITLRSQGSADAVAVVSGVNAEPTLARTRSRLSDAALRNQFAHFQVSKLSSTLSAEAITSQTPRGGAGGLGAWTGWRLWGGSSSPAARFVRREVHDPHRAHGNNQPGAIPGFSKYWKTQKRDEAPSATITETVDRNALSENLCDNTTGAEEGNA